MHDAAPIVGRPRGNAWRVLQADGIVWEGQVYIIGEHIDLAARLILTRRRIALARGGAVALEADLEWLEPAPVINRLGDVTIFLDPEGTGDPERIRLQFRDSRASADDFMHAIGADTTAPTRHAPASWERWGSSWSMPAPVDLPVEEDAAAPGDDGATVHRTGWEAYDPALAPSVLDTGDFPPIAGAYVPDEPAPVARPLGPDETPSFSPSAAYAPHTPSSPHASRWLVPIDGLTPKQRFLPRRTFSFRLAGLAMLLTVSAAFGAGLLPVPGIDPLPRLAPSVGQPGGGVAQVVETDAPVTGDVTPDESAIAEGVGGTNGEPIAMSETPTPAPTETATSDSAADDAVAPTATADVTDTTGAAPAAPAEQVVVARAFRATILSASRGAEFAALGLGATGAGDWVVVVADVTNATSAEAPFRMTAFRLQANGEDIALDPVTADVAVTLGLEPAFGDTTGVRIAAGETVRVALVFQAPAGTEGGRLLFAEQTVDLGPSLAAGANPQTLPAPIPAAVALPATVTGILDGATLAVDIDGVASTVRIAGVAAPAGGACYGGESAIAASDLLAGQVVLLEDSGIAADGTPLANVWVIDPEGKQAPSLAAAILAADGAISPDPAAGAASYSAWIAAAADAARGDGNGLWGACGM